MIKKSKMDLKLFLGYIFFIFKFFVFTSFPTVLYSQTDSILELSDSIVVMFMPINSVGSFSFNEDEFRISENQLKRYMIINDEKTIFKIESCLEENKMDTINKKALSVLVIFDFYKNGTLKKAVLMDNIGLISYNTKPDIIFYKPNLNIFFRELTNQIDKKCK